MHRAVFELYPPKHGPILTSLGRPGQKLGFGVRRRAIQVLKTKKYSESRPKVSLETWGSERPPDHWKASKILQASQGYVTMGSPRILCLAGWQQAAWILDAHTSPSRKKGKECTVPFLSYTPPKMALF